MRSNDLKAQPEPINLEADSEVIIVKEKDTDQDSDEINDLRTAIFGPIRKTPVIVPSEPRPRSPVLAISPSRKLLETRLNHIQAVLHRGQKSKGMGLTQLREWKKRLEKKKEETLVKTEAQIKPEPTKRKRDKDASVDVDQYLREIQEGNQRRETESLKRRCVRPEIKEEPIKQEPAAPPPVVISKEEERSISLQLRYANRNQMDGFFSFVLSLSIETLKEKTHPAPLPLAFEDGSSYTNAFTPAFFEEVRADLENCLGQADFSKVGKFILQIHHEANGFAFLSQVCDLSSRAPLLPTHFRHDEIVLCVLDTGVEVGKIVAGSRMFALHFLGIVHQDQDASGKLAPGLFIRAKSSEELTTVAGKARVFHVLFLEYAQTMMREYRMIHLAEFLGLPRLLNPGTSESYITPTYIESANFFTPALNTSQIQAITAALSFSSEVTLIQGPPGTGKTHTLMCLLSIALQRSQTQRPILVCAPSNAAIDEIVTRAVRDGFVDHKGERREDVKIVRVGNREKEKLELKQRSQPERSVQGKEVQQVSLQDLVHTQLLGLGMQDDQATLNGLRKCLEKIEARMAKCKEKRLTDRYERLHNERKDMLVALNREKSCNTLFEDKKRATEFAILATADVIFTTLSGAASKCLEKLGRSLQFVVIDEACQAVELTSLIPLQYRIQKVVMIGDPKQLPATTFSDTAVRAGYNRSLFERLMACGVPVFMLKDQYRMSPLLCSFPSTEFYGGELLSSPQLRPPPKWLPLCRFLFIDLKSSSESKGDDEGASLCNLAEAAFITQIYNRFAQYHGTRMNIGIITPYRKQVQAIKKALGDKFHSQWTKDIEVNTVDGFQGREKDAIIFSAVRSHDQIGFLKDVRRLNVAITRARFALWVVGRAETLQRNETWARFIAHCEKQRALIRAHTFAEVSSRFVD